MADVSDVTTLLDPSTVEHVFRAVDLIGVGCNGVIGGRVARQMRFDAVGFATLAIMSALGGGIVRDLMLNTVPVALTDPFYLGTALAGATVAFLWKLDSRWSGRIILLFDGLVLGCWSATGASKALTLGFDVMPAILMGLLTAVGGSMIRDVSVGRIPRVFGGNNLYATPAVVAALIQIVAQKSGAPSLGMGLAIVIGLGFTLLAHRRRWQLPPAPERTITLTPAQLKRLLRLRNMRLRKASTGKGYVVTISDSDPVWAQIEIDSDDSAEPPQPAGA